MAESGRGFGAGKIILLGEHSVVYGHPALAAGLPDGMEARVRVSDAPAGRLRCARWNIDLPLTSSEKIASAVLRVLQAVGGSDHAWDVELDPHLPPAAGLGSSAALCVSVARAGADCLGRSLSPAEAAEAAFEGERCFHGNPSGIDNTVAAYGGLLWFRRPAARKAVRLDVPLRLVIAHSGISGETAKQVERVRSARDTDPVRYDQIFDRIEGLVQRALQAISNADIDGLGQMMDENHRCLQEMGVSAPVLDRMVQIARDAGALGAKLTGAGGGGCMLALCSDRPETVARALEASGFLTFSRTIEPQV